MADKEQIKKKNDKKNVKEWLDRKKKAEQSNLDYLTDKFKEVLVNK